MDIIGYLNRVRTLYAGGQTTEHSFRPALAELFQSIDPALTVINEPKHITDVGAPDFVFNRGEVAIGWCEAKDIGKDVRKFAANDYSKEQKDRYRKGLPNLIYTNGLDFEFIVEGEVVDFITIADLIPTMPARNDNFAALENRLRDFATATPLSIGSSKRLAEMMAGKAAIIKDIMGRALVVDFKALEAGGKATDLIGQYEAFKTNLIHDITVEEFADIYAETIAYGLFAARLHDGSPDTFNRAEALELLPKSNPFLRELFIYIAGPNLDERLRRVIDELCNVFLATNMEQVLRHFGKVTARQDPFLHFYEVFLAEYNPAKRKARGVWYTPEPVVNFIVRAVDEVLKSEFGLADGLADTSKIRVEWDTGQNDPKTGKPATISKQVHRVQILDPATGTGTFLAEVVKLVSERVKGIAPGQWSNYVEQDLIPRIHGFELLMASYAMCHMKLDMILTGLGYRPSAQPPRLGVYLTNSLEEGERVEQTLFGHLGRAIAEESKLASDIKRQTPIMCVIGNPPYAISSSNQGAWITSMIQDYKSDLNEQNIQALSDDYIKFIKLAQHIISKQEHGIVSMIANNAFIDGLIQRNMRRSLSESFQKIYIVDLHGSLKRREKSPDGSPDINVFDIQQGVCIFLFVKNGNPAPCEIHHFDVQGGRAAKNEWLFSSSLNDVDFSKFVPEKPSYHFVPKDFSGREAYNSGFELDKFFPERGTGVKFRKDPLLVSPHLKKNDVRDMVLAIQSWPKEALLSHYNFSETTDWKLDEQKQYFEDFDENDIIPVDYRPFDVHYCYYPIDKINKIIPRGDSRRNLMRHLFGAENLALVIGRQGQVTGNEPWNLCFAADSIVDQNIFYRGGGLTCPVYLFPDTGSDQADAFKALGPSINFDPKLYARIREAAGLTGAPAAPDGTDAFRKATGDARPDEVKVFDYIYGVLHCPTYRETYAEFLKIDFPRVPFPASPEVFSDVSAKGEALRRLHLMEDAAIGLAPYPFHGEGDSAVERPSYGGERVAINATQYFENVPEVAWSFHIGGYQPAQKWLKDRKGRALSWDDIRHYQKIIKVLAETDRIMREIELPLD